MHNEYLPFVSEVLDVIKHTDIEYTFRMSFKGDVKPGQFFEVSISKMEKVSKEESASQDEEGAV